MPALDFSVIALKGDLKVKDATKTDLDALFANRAKGIAAAEKAKSEKEERESANRRLFAELVETTIKPSMEQFADYLREQGCETRIETKNEQVDYLERKDTHEDKITFYMSPNSSGPYRGDYPHFAAILSKSNGMVSFHESTMMPGRGGHTGGCGQAKLSKVSAEMIDELIAKTIRKAFGS